MKKFIFCIAVLSALMMLFTACDIFNNAASVDSKKKDTSTENYTPPEPKDYTPTEDNIRLLGRTIIDNDIAIMAHSGTGIEFNVRANKLSATFIKDSWNRDTRIVAFLNDERIFDEILKEDSKEFVIFDSDKEKKGVVRIVKASEDTMANAGITKLTAEGEISPTKAKKYKIEFIGDSATAGYGVDETDPEKGNSIETEDITKVYAYKVARALDADYSIVCASGWGAYSGYTDQEGNINTACVIPPVYDKVGFCDSEVGSVKPGKTDWDFNRFKPDIVSILLGANDQGYTRGDIEKCAAFKAAYIDFISDIRAKNPNAYIVCCSGLAPDDLKEYIEQAASEYKSETGDNKVSYLYIPLANGQTEGFGGGYHPTDLSYSNAANYIVPNFRNLLK